jgi:hypothetical protein
MKKKNHGNGTTTVTIYMPSERAKNVKLLAEDGELSVSQYINQIVKQHLAAIERPA